MDLSAIVVVLLLPCVSVSQGVNSLTGHKFSRELERMDRNGIGAPNLQKYYDELSYDKPADDGADIVRKMTENLEHMFQTLTNQLKKVKKAVEEEFAFFSQTDPGTFPQCCVINGTYSPKFRTQVSENSACVSRSLSSAHFPNGKIQEVMKGNYENNPNMLWQYYGGSDGTFLIYPAHRFNPNCFSYDPRLRQYYVATATNKPKDVVIAVDTSGVTASRSNYESKTLLVVAREAVQHVIDTLNPNDRIGLVAFNEQAIKPSSCQGSQLAKATTTNKRILKEFTNNWSSSKTSHYAVGIKAAFSYFNINETMSLGNSRESIILFLAAGDNAGGDPLDIIKTENEARNNYVTILTYSFGQGLSPYWKDGLRNMSKQVKNDKTPRAVMEGTYEHIQNDSLLRSTMASYYTVLPSANLGDEPVFSVPYVDRRSKETGLITSLCLPLEVSGSLVGVTCTDILLDELFSDITSFKQGELSYAFMIDGQGRVMVHYLQPTPKAITNDPDPIDIHTLETSPEAKLMIESMKRGENGSSTFSYLRTISRGILEYEGIEAKLVEANYNWRKVQGTNFSLCVVLGKNDQQSRLLAGQERLETKGVFYYHRLDLNTQNTQKCREYERYSTKEKSVVMLTPHAFEKPYEYLYRNETVTEVIQYTKYLNNEYTIQVNEHFKLKENVKSSVQATYKAEQIWKNNQDQAQFVVWRYLGTRDGHVRIYPAVELSKDYDHFMRPWWRRTIAQKGKYVVISPYVDNWGAGLIVTQCKAIYEGRTSEMHSPDDIVEVVQCIDYPYPYFSRMFLNIYPECNSKEYSCMVIDISGFLVIHPTFSIDTDIERKHLGTMEKKIMEDLLKNGIIVKESCLDIETKKQLFSYRVQLSDQEDPENKLSTVGYMIAPVLNSNTFIIVKKKDQLGQGTCCPNSNISPLDYACTSSGSDCCLCHKVVSYDTCQEKTTSGELYHICSARLPDSNTRLEPELEKIKTLEPCFDARCDARKNETICYQVAGCSWCSYDEDGTEYPRSKQCCNIFETCPFGKVLHQKETKCSLVTAPPPTSRLKDQDSLTYGVAIGAGVVVLIIIIGVIVFCYRRNNNGGNEHTDYITPISERNDNPAYVKTEEIQYLHEEELKGHQLNQYSPFNSSDGSLKGSANTANVKTSQ